MRFAGFALSYNVATSIFGGTAPALNSWLISRTGNEMMPAYYMMASCAAGMIALKFVIETAGQSIRGRQMPGTEASRLELAARG